MDSLLTGLEPKGFWRHFEAISRFPRPSGGEERVARYVLDEARRLSHDGFLDEAGNVVVRMSASKGLQGACSVCLQCHLDMVCEKEQDVAHDFHASPLRLQRDGDWIGACGTTLGADNSVGIAACLALMEDEAFPHGPLEMLFTVEEESGAAGARAVGPETLQSRILLNLDSEEDAFLCIGSAAGRGTHVSLSPRLVPPAEGTAGLRLVVGGLRGGHSGGDIHQGRANAIKVLARALQALVEEVDTSVASLAAGGALNAIPREAEALLAIDQEETERACQVVEGVCSELRGRYAACEPSLGISLLPAEAEPPISVLAPEELRRLLDVLFALPHGVLAWSKDMERLVETSTNLARLRWRDGCLDVGMLSRSSRLGELAQVCRTIESVARLSGATFRSSPGSRGWQPEPEARLVRVAAALWEKLFGEKPRVQAVHAGLECELFLSAIEGMEMLSFGPTLRDVHTPSEQLQISTVPRFYQFLCALLAELAA